MRRAAGLLKKYRQGKVNLERRIIDNEQFWKLLRHWPQMEKTGEGGNPGDPQPTSGWLVNCILSKHADAMDCYQAGANRAAQRAGGPGGGGQADPYPAGHPEEEPVQADLFQRMVVQTQRAGCAVYGVFWDAGEPRPVWGTCPSGGWIC